MGMTRSAAPTEIACYFVSGDPRTKGSMRVFGPGRFAPANTELKAWESHVCECTRTATDKRDITGAVKVRLRFGMRRPKGHYLPSGQVRDRSPRWHTTRGDLDKLVRAVLDGITLAGLWRDDSQVVSLHAEKVYDSEPGCHVWIGGLHG